MSYLEQELISIPIGEGSNVNALFYKSTVNRDGEEKEPIVIHVHGFLGNFLQGSQRFLPPLLAKGGYSSIAINTRLANFGLFYGYGIIDNTIPQIDGVITFLKNMGYKKIIISGYSLGGVVVLRYASLRNDPQKYSSLKGVVALATPYSMPDSIRKRWNRFESQPSYDEVYQEAKEILKPDPLNSDQDRTIIIYKGKGNTFQPAHTEIYTYKTWWFLAGPEAESAKGYKQIENIKAPILLIQGWNDDVVHSSETHDLAQTAINAGNQDVSAFYLNAGHTLEGREEELGDIIVRWLDRRFRNSDAD